MATAPISYGSDYATEQANIERGRRYAELMQQQSLQPTEQQTAGGWVIPTSWTQGLSKALQGVAGQYKQNQLDERQKALAEQMKQKSLSDVSDFTAAMQGRPAQTFTTPANEMGDEQAVQNVPAQAGDRQKALAIALGSQNPMLQNAGTSMLAQMLKGPETAFGKIDPKDYTAESVKAFAAGGGKDYGMLVPVRKSEIAPGGQVYNPYEIKPGQVMQDPNKPFNVGPNGELVPNQPFQQYQFTKSAKGAPNVNVKTEVKTGESLAAQVGPMMKDSTAIAEGAVKQVDAANRIVQAIDTNKAFAGPGSEARLKIGQIGQVLGIGGKDEAEKIANTRQTIRGLAELTLQGRQQMRGQGAITDSEGKLAEKAMSGDISELTAAEIKQLAKSSERAARFNYAEHQRKMKVMQENPALNQIAPFYQGPAMPPEAGVNPNIDALLNKYK